MYSEDVSLLIEGLKRLRRGALLQIIAVIISITGLIGVIVAGLLILSFPLMRIQKITVLSIFILAIVLIVTSILSLTGFTYWFGAARSLKMYNEDRLGIGWIGVILTIVGVIMVVLGIPLYIISVYMSTPTLIHLYEVEISNMMMLSTIIGTFFLGVIGSILVFLGLILFSIMLIRLGDMEGVSSSIHVAGIFYLIGLILLVIPHLSIFGVIMLFIATILIYGGAGETLKKMG